VNRSRPSFGGALHTSRRCLACILLASLFASEPLAAEQEKTQQPACAKDAILVFDSSGSMAGPGFGEMTTTRIEKVRQALRHVLPSVAPVRNLGLIVFGPGAHANDSCANIELRLRPGRNSAERIMAELNSVQPYGQTPLTGAVQEAAKVLRYRERPAVIVLLTDGEETCGGNPCALAQMLKRDSADLTVHVIGYMTGHTSGMPARYATRCLPEQTGGLYITTETTDELIAALQKTLGCALLSGLDGVPPLSARQR
jgi:Ca-activated chloride channel homolog